LFPAIQLYWNFKLYCFYFFPKAALSNWGCSLSKDAAYTRTFTVHVSEESLILVLNEKNTISAMFSFQNTQEAVRRETTEGSSIEFIGYRILPHEQNGCTVLFPRHQSTKVCW